jgi:hypothetical protein
MSVVKPWFRGAVPAISFTKMMTTTPKRPASAVEAAVKAR